MVFRLNLLVIAGLAAFVALTGLLWQSGVRTRSLEEIYYLNWAISSDRLAERAYGRLLGGDTAGGLDLFRLAVRRDPASPYRWCDYAEALLTTGDKVGARKCMLRGVELGRYIGPILMRAVNIAYRTDDRAGALHHGNDLLTVTDSYDDSVFTAWERMELGTAEVLDSGIPNRRAAQAYMRHLMRIPAPQTAALAASWAWIARRDFADDPLADEYAASLVRLHDAIAAAKFWASYTGSREPGYPSANAVFNGSFEREPAGTVFDWRIDPVESVRVERDPSWSAAGRTSLRLDFDNTRNLSYAHVTQRVLASPGIWGFTARVRTEGITTDEGIGFRIYDADLPRDVDVLTTRLTGTHDWTELSVRLSVPAPARLLTVQVVRRPSLRFDNKLGGTVWIDTVELRPSSQLR